MDTEVRQGRTDREGERQPGFLIRRLHQIHSALFAEESAGLDITPPQYGVLSVIALQPGLDQSAIGVAQAINQAQQTYNLRVTNAAANWAGAPDSETKYELISLYVPFAASTLAAYEPAGYNLTLGSSLNIKVVIDGPNGTVTY